MIYNRVFDMSTKSVPIGYICVYIHRYINIYLPSVNMTINLIMHSLVRTSVKIKAHCQYTSAQITVNIW